MKRFLYRLKNYFFPTAGNGYHPGIFKRESVIAIAAIIVFLNAAYFVTVVVVFKNSNFLGAVLPGVLTALTNNDRTSSGVGTLAENQLLVEAAQNSANDMAAKGYFSHVTPDGKTPWSWLDQVGYNYTYAGQNLAVNFDDAEDVEAAWMKSPTHHANLVKPQFTQIGIAVANGIYKGQNATFVVQFFGTPETGAKAAPVTPVKTVTTTATTSGAVLGAETGPVSQPATATSAPSTPAPGFLATAAASPNHTLMILLGGFLFVLALLFFLAIFVKVRIQYLSVLLGGIILLGIAGASFFMSETRSSNAPVELPTDTNSATVYTGFLDAGN